MESEPVETCWRSDNWIFTDNWTHAPLSDSWVIGVEDGETLSGQPLCPSGLLQVLAYLHIFMQHTSFF